MQPLYIFIDESGDFVFTPKGSKYYVITAIITYNPNEALEQLALLKFDLLTRRLFPDLSQEYREKNICNGFHATEDKQVVRNEVFKIISNMKEIKAHAIVIRKNMTNPSLYSPEKFYPKMSSYLIDYIQKSYEYSSFCVMFNGSPVNRLRQSMLKGVKQEISKIGDKKYSIYFPNSSTERILDIADYVCWAIAKKWERSDNRSYNTIEGLLGSGELDIFRDGDTKYYDLAT